MKIATGGTQTIPVRNLRGDRSQQFELKHDKSGKPDIYFSGPRFGLLNKREAYSLAVALVDLADTLPE